MVNNFGPNYTLNTNGVIIPDTSSVQSTVQEEFKEALGTNISLEESTPQGRLIDVETTARKNTINFNATMGSVLVNINSATGTILDAWGANFGIYRNSAIPSSVEVLVTGVADTIIPAGSEASTSLGVIWQAQSEIIIGDDGTAAGIFICSQTGAIALGLNELTNIIASTSLGVDGWETITNTEVATLGADVENDSSFRQRIFNALFTGSALFGNYASSAYRVDNVFDVFVKENPYSTSLILDNVTLPAHSVYCAVEGGNVEDVAYALYSVKSAGANWAGNTTVSVIDKTFRTQNTVTYQIPTNPDIVIEINATSLSNSNANLESEIGQTILNYAQGQYDTLGYPKLGIRALISPFAIASLLNAQISGLSVNSVQVGLKTPAPHAVVDIIKASATDGLIWASVNSVAFASKTTQNGTYNFIFNGTNWQLNGTNVNLSDYGITATSVNNNPITNDKISIIFATGQLTQSNLKLFASESPNFNLEDITVNIND